MENLESRENRSELTRRIQTASFAAAELQLFLDTHPNCREALERLRDSLERRREAVARYEKLYGPISLDGMESACRYDWIDRPWPWEGEA